MATFESIALQGQAFAQDNMGDAFTYSNTNCTGVFNMVMTDLTLEAQGIRQEVDAVLVAAKAQFPSVPVVRGIVSYANTNYSIRDISTDTQAYTLQLKKLS